MQRAAVATITAAVEVALAACGSLSTRPSRVNLKASKGIEVFSQEMVIAIVGVTGILLGAIVGAVGQQLQAARNHRWQKEDLLNTAKRVVYAEYVRSISASFAQAQSGHRSRTEDGSLRAATAEIQILAAKDVAGRATALTEKVIEVHTRIAEGGVEKADIDHVDHLRLELINLFKADLGIKVPGAAATAVAPPRD